MPARMSESTLSRALADEAATQRLGQRLAQGLAARHVPLASPAISNGEAGPAAMVVHLRGDLGAGKTTLVRALLNALGWRGTVRSPSYTLLEPYALGAMTYVHVDLYRLRSPEDIEDLGLRDYLQAAHTLLIEWPEHGGAMTPPADLDIHLQFEAPGRRASLLARTLAGAEWLTASLPHDNDSK
jgi:tRNA threonylcarbamoyladenosine biosynthesis protein TsaE